MKDSKLEKELVMSFDKRELKNLFNRIGGVMLFFLVVTNVVSGGAYLFGAWFTINNSSVSAEVTAELLNALAYAVSFLLPVGFFYAISKKKQTEPVGLSLESSEEMPVLATLAVVFLGSSACLASSYVNSILFPVSDRAYDIYFAQELGGGYSLVLMFISVAIIPAFVEELLFRGVILSNIRPYSESDAVLISAILFGLMHQAPYQLFYTTAVGVILGVIRVKTGSIWMGVLVHFFNNFYSILQSYLLERYDASTGETLYMILTMSVILVGAILGAVLYGVHMCRKRPKAIETIGFFQRPALQVGTAVRKQENVAIYKAFFCPTIIAFIVISALTMITMAIELNGV